MESKYWGVVTALCLAAAIGLSASTDAVGAAVKKKAKKPVKQATGKAASTQVGADATVKAKKSGKSVVKVKKPTAKKTTAVMSHRPRA